MATSIALIAYRKSSSGIASYTIELAKALGHIFEVTMPAFGLSPLTKEKLRERGIKVIDLGREALELEWLGPLLEYRLLSRKVKKCLSNYLGELDCLLFTIPGFAMDFEPQKIIVKAWSYHGLFSMIATRLKYLPLKLKVPSVIATIEYWLMDNSVFTRAEKIICSTWASYKFHKAKFGGKVVYIPPPMESPLITEKKSTKKLRVLFVSRDLSIQRKNLTTLFKALNALNEEHLRRVKVILVGRNAHKFKDWFNWLKMRAVEVDVIGYVDREEMMDIYLSSDVLVYPSYYEELGYAVLEAMAHGLPVIASAIPSFNDLVIDGYNGFLIEPADYEKLASLLSILIEDEDIRHKMAERSSKYVKEKFDPKLVAQRFKDVIEDIRARVKG